MAVNEFTYAGGGQGPSVKWGASCDNPASFSQFWKAFNDLYEGKSVDQGACSRSRVMQTVGIGGAIDERATA